MFSFATLTLPAWSLANASMCGATMLQEGHEGDMAKTRTGSGDLSTLSGKLESLIHMGCGSKSPSVFSSAPHFPHLGCSSNWLEFTRFLVPHSLHRRITVLSEPWCDPKDSGSWHLPHLAWLRPRPAGIRLRAPQWPHWMKSVLSLFIPGSFSCFSFLRKPRHAYDKFKS
jgi:hypothetical protein